MKELESDFKKASSYNAYSKFHEMVTIRAKAGAYREILRPLLLDHTKQHLNGDVKRFNEELKVFQEKCSNQINKVLNDVI